MQFVVVGYSAYTNLYKKYFLLIDVPCKIRVQRQLQTYLCSHRYVAASNSSIFCKHKKINELQNAFTVYISRSLSAHFIWYLCKAIHQCIWLRLRCSQRLPVHSKTWDSLNETVWKYGKEEHILTCKIKENVAVQKQKYSYNIISIFKIAQYTGKD